MLELTSLVRHDALATGEEGEIPSQPNNDDDEPCLRRNDGHTQVPIAVTAATQEEEVESFQDEPISDYVWPTPSRRQQVCILKAMQVLLCILIPTTLYWQFFYCDPHSQRARLMLRDQLVQSSWDGGTALSTLGSAQERAYSFLSSNPDRVCRPSIISSNLDWYAFLILQYTNDLKWESKTDPPSRGDSFRFCNAQAVNRFNADGLILSQAIYSCNEEGRLVSLELNGQYNTSIPQEIGLLNALTSLQAVDVDLNAYSHGADTNVILHGTIPSELGLLTSLVTLDLSSVESDDNCSFESVPCIVLTGTIPTELGRLTSLKYLDLSGHAIEGALPTELKQLSSLKRLNVQRNCLTGLSAASLAFFVRPGFHVYVGENAFIRDEGSPAAVEGTVTLVPRDNSHLCEHNYGCYDVPVLCTRAPAGMCLKLLSLVASNPVCDFIHRPSSSDEDNGSISDCNGNSVEDIEMLRELLVSRDAGLIERLADSRSPQSSAFQWMSMHDSISCRSIVSRIQRFVLSVLYFSAYPTTEAQEQCPPWMTTSSECEWFDHVSFNEYDLRRGGQILLQCLYTGEIGLLEIKALLSMGNQLPEEIGMLNRIRDFTASLGSGSPDATTLPRGIGRLTELASLTLNGDMHGTIPDSLVHLTALTSIAIVSSIGGTLPIGLGALSRLQHVHLACRLTGTIPPDLGDLTALTYLHLENVQSRTNDYGDEGGIDGEMSGPFLTNMIRLQDLELLRIIGHSLGASLPTEIGMLGNLATLHLANNVLTGSIPSEVGLLTLLTELSFERNQLSSTLPVGLAKLSNSLLRLDLSQNKFFGRLPVEWSRLTTLRSLFVQENLISGTFPHEFKHLSRLQYMNASHNKLRGSGKVIAIFAKETTMFSLDLSDNVGLTGAWPPADEVELEYVDTIDLRNTSICCSWPADYVLCSDCGG